MRKLRRAGHRAERREFFRDDSSETTNESTNTGIIDETDLNMVGGGKSKAHKSYGANMRLVKDNADSLDPWLMAMCQMPISLTNAMNNGDCSQVKEIINKFMKADVVYNDCQYSQDVENNTKFVHRMRGCNSMAKISSVHSKATLTSLLI